MKDIKITPFVTLSRFNEPAQRALLLAAQKIPIHQQFPYYRYLHPGDIAEGIAREGTTLAARLLRSTRLFSDSETDAIPQDPELFSSDGFPETSYYGHWVISYAAQKAEGEARSASTEDLLAMLLSDGNYSEFRYSKVYSMVPALREELYKAYRP